MHVCGDFMCTANGRQIGIAPRRVRGLSEDTNVEFLIAGVATGAMRFGSIRLYEHGGVGVGLQFGGPNRIMFDVHAIKGVVLPHFDIVLRWFGVSVKHSAW